MKANLITRRTFLKTTAFTAGSFAILSRGIALANTGSGSGSQSGSSSTPPPCSRKWVTGIAVEFNEVHGHPLNDPQWREWSGEHYIGVLTYGYKTCQNGTTSQEISVTAKIASGGYIAKNDDGSADSQLKQGSQTAWPPGIFPVTTGFSSPGQPTAGFNVNNPGAYVRDPTQPTHKYRSAMKIHYLARPEEGSAGCIVFLNKSEFDAFTNMMRNSRAACQSRRACPHLSAVQMKVRYADSITSPTYIWDRHKMGVPVPDSDPTTTPKNLPPW